MLKVDPTAVSVYFPLEVFGRLSVSAFDDLIGYGWYLLVPVHPDRCNYEPFGDYLDLSRAYYFQLQTSIARDC